MKKKTKASAADLLRRVEERVGRDDDEYASGPPPKPKCPALTAGMIGTCDRPGSSRSGGFCADHIARLSPSEKYQAITARNERRRLAARRETT